MRSALILILSAAFATSAAAQGGLHPYGMSGPLAGRKPAGGGAFANPYRAPASPGFGAPAFPKPPAAPGDTYGGQAFKPYKGSSVYSDRGGLNPYAKPAKPKGGFSTYDH